MATRNIFLSSTFDDAVTPLYGWQMSDTVSHVSGQGVNGSKCIYFAPTHLMKPTLTQSADVIPGGVYRFKCQAKRGSDGDDYVREVNLEVSYKGAGGTWVTINKNFKKITTSYTEYEHVFTIPADITSENAWFHLRIYSPDRYNYLETWVDNVELIGDDNVGNEVGTYVRMPKAINFHTSTSTSSPIAYTIWRNALSKIVEKAQVGATTWYKFRRIEHGDGWCRAIDLGFENDSVPSPNTLYVGKINAVDVRVRPEMNTSGEPLGKYPNGSPIGYRLTSDPSWHETYWGFNPTKIGYSQSTYITTETKTTAQLLADIAKFWYDKNWDIDDFGMDGKWCQWWVNFCVTQAGLAGQNAWTTNKNCTGGWGAMSSTATNTASVGRVFYTRKDGDTASHTGIVVKIDWGRVYVVDANYEGSTSLSYRLFDPSALPSDTTFLGYVQVSGT